MLLCFHDLHCICKFENLFITSSSCLMCGRKSFWNDSKASFNLSSKVFLFKLVLLFEAHLSPFLVRDKISTTWLSLWTSRTIAWICSLIRRCWRTVIMHVFSISSWCLSSWKVELIHPKSLIRDTSSLKLVVDSWKKKQRTHQGSDQVLFNVHYKCSQTSMNYFVVAHCRHFNSFKLE